MDSNRHWALTTSHAATRAGRYTSAGPLNPQCAQPIISITGGACSLNPDMVDHTSQWAKHSPGVREQKRGSLVSASPAMIDKRWEHSVQLRATERENQQATTNTAIGSSGRQWEEREPPIVLQPTGGLEAACDIQPAEPDMTGLLVSTRYHGNTCLKRVA